MMEKVKSPCKGNILLVDDTPDNLRVLSSILTKHGYYLRKALNGEMAITAAHTLIPDLILLDINMPYMNGYEVCQALKDSEKTRNIPIIFISVLDDVLDKVRAFQVGGIDYITKPFQLEEVLARIENQLKIQRLQDQLHEQNRLLEKQNFLLLKEIENRKKAEVALKKANKKLQKLACIDGLTQVSNRRKFDDYLKQEWDRLERQQHPLSLILCDIDYFKAYNDTYGHPAGDECLKQVAQAICQAVKRPADLVARYGGEEFAAILPHTTDKGALSVACNIQREIQQLDIQHCASDVGDIITISLGICTLIPTREVSLHTLIWNADKALYQAKQAGRNCYCTYLTQSQDEVFKCGNHQCELLEEIQG
ncbi:GGDEF domain-containing response regulator [Oscillatoria acuminata]|uniref:Diguanylate cyclase (GGDEF) domain-containing protein n=1 Tax=Oscillatoria acuminata PCC 6304 TaxID=56110 RepID=K9TK96_9CYAN|nr:PleD family two-component system response regulator [Oscillatoria acuminata]AFY82970.1 diguanylate cyclase (GGDEF) domain-containing protein [Oscillatoria acuminata PCC 6304]